jgi:hypothetical protein
MHRFAKLLAAVVVALAVCGAAFADSTPVGPLPAGKVTSVSTPRGTLIAVALPRQKASTGLVWRVARAYNAKVVKQVSEADVGSSVVLVYRAAGKGKTSVILALTKGDTSPKAVKAATYRITVT